MNGQSAPEKLDDAEWIRCLDCAEEFMPTARAAWNRFTDKPWNKHAMKRVLSEFAAHLSVIHREESE